jgi:hypothetical protein
VVLPKEGDEIIVDGKDVVPINALSDALFKRGFHPLRRKVRNVLEPLGLRWDAVFVPKASFEEQILSDLSGNLEVTLLRGDSMHRSANSKPSLPS